MEEATSSSILQLFMKRLFKNITDFFSADVSSDKTDNTICWTRASPTDIHLCLGGWGQTPGNHFIIITRDHPANKRKLGVIWPRKQRTTTP